MLPSSEQRMCVLYARDIKRSLRQQETILMSSNIMDGAQWETYCRQRNNMPTKQRHPWDGQVSAAAEGNDDDDDDIDACQLQSGSLYNTETCQQENDALS